MAAKAPKRSHRPPVSIRCEKCVAVRGIAKGHSAGPTTRTRPPAPREVTGAIPALTGMAECVLRDWRGVRKEPLVQRLGGRLIAAASADGDSADVAAAVDSARENSKRRLRRKSVTAVVAATATGGGGGGWRRSRPRCHVSVVLLRGRHAGARQHRFGSGPHRLVTRTAW
ncbi:unnamed protein product [Lampetra planeri]